MEKDEQHVIGLISMNYYRNILMIVCLEVRQLVWLCIYVYVHDLNTNEF